MRWDVTVKENGWTRKKIFQLRVAIIMIMKPKGFQ